MKMKALLMLALVTFVAMAVPTLVGLSTSGIAEREVRISRTDNAARSVTARVIPLGEPISTPGAPT